jgi:YVTN family beta-propeller protein
VSGGKLLKFRVSDNEKVGELAAGLTAPTQIALSRNSDTAYVTSFENSKQEINVVNTVTMTKIGVIPDPAMLKPHGATMTPDFQYVLTTNTFSDNISIIRTRDNTVVQTVPLSGSVPMLPIGYTYKFEPYQMVITPDSKYAYIACRKSNDVRVLDLTQRKIIDSISVGLFPVIPGITPDGQYVYVPNRNSNSVTVIRTSDRKVENTFSNIGVQPHAVAISKDGKFAYVSCENLNSPDPPHHPTVGGKQIGIVTVIDLTTKTILRQLEVGNFAAGIALTN